MSSSRAAFAEGPDSGFNDRFVAVGDIMLGDSATCVGFGFRSRYPRDAAPALTEVAPLFRGAIVLGNLECVLAEAGSGKTRLLRDQMRGDPEYAAQLRRAGVTIVSIANNHIMQHGRLAFAETLRHLNTAGVHAIGLRGTDGWCCAPLMLTTREKLRVGLLAYCWRPRQYDRSEPLYAEGNAESAARDVARLRMLCDTVVVSLHWGEEFVRQPSVDEVAAARALVDAGASLIVGHHPHVVRPVERYRGGVICYSLGNFATDMIWDPELRTGLVIECGLRTGDLSEARLWNTRVDDNYRPLRLSASPRIESEPISGLTPLAYEASVRRALRRQRIAVYRYALRNVGRFPAGVLAGLLTSTVRNKIRAALPRRTSSQNEKERNDPDKGPGQTDRLSILHVVAPARFGGLESVVRALVYGQRRQGHLVRVAAVLSPGKLEKHPFVESLEELGIDVDAIVVGDRDYLGERRAIRRLCVKHRPDIVHTHGFRCDVMDGQVARKAGIATVSTCHGFIESDLRGRVYQWLQRRALRHFDAVVAVSASVEQRLRSAGLDTHIVHRLPNGFVSNREFLSRDEARRVLHVSDAPVIGWVGRLSSEKGADVALEALAKIGRDDVRLVVIGDGRNADVLRSRASMLGVGERVDWHGAIPDAARLFKAFDVFLLSSRTEGTPIALFEAMAAQIPVVATRVGGVPDVVDESSAYLVDSEDALGMGRAIAAILASPSRADMRVARARSLLDEKFGVDVWLSAHEQLYRSILGVRRVPTLGLRAAGPRAERRDAPLAEFL